MGFAKHGSRSEIKNTILYFVHYTERDNFAIMIKEHGRKYFQHFLTLVSRNIISHEKRFIRVGNITYLKLVIWNRFCDIHV